MSSENMKISITGILYVDHIRKYQKLNQYFRILLKKKG